MAFLTLLRQTKLNYYLFYIKKKITKQFDTSQTPIKHKKKKTKVLSLIVILRNVSNFSNT